MECVLWAEDDTSTRDTTPAKRGTKTTVKHRTCTYLGKPLPCYTSRGVWHQKKQCYLAKLEPQPPHSDPAWQGNTDGAIYGCYTPLDNNTAVRYLWLPDSPAEVDLEDLARQAVDSLHLRAIEIGLPVPDDDEHMIYVGAPVYLWTADPGPATIGPRTARASAGDVTVTATARLDGIVWDMGDGTKVRCMGPTRSRGTQYRPAFGLQDSPTCGHRYERAPERVTITATSHWQVTWRGSGETGTFTFELTRSTSRPVGEIQAIVEKRS